MIEKHDVLYKDLQAIKQISVIPGMLDAICRMTGLGFAAVARVTNDRWLACTVKDDVNFGLAEGGELKIETTICNEIRDNKKAVVIDHVEMDEEYKNHHTPKIYGLQSYISFPIILKNGDFFGTICAIGTEPARLNDPKIKITFEMFADLISFHLQSLELMERSHSALHETNRQLTISDSEIEKYKKVSDHNMKEQVRKITIYTDILINDSESVENGKVKETALKINSFAKELTYMLEDLSKLSALSENFEFKKVNLTEVITQVRTDLKPMLEELNAKVNIAALPTLSAIPSQVTELFRQLIHFGMDLPKKSNTPVFEISSKSDSEFCDITMEYEGIDLEKINMERAFDIFVHSSDDASKLNYAAGLAYCQKIVNNHKGSISSHTPSNTKLIIHLVLPLSQTSTVPQKTLV